MARLRMKIRPSQVARTSLLSTRTRPSSRRSFELGEFGGEVVVEVDAEFAGDFVFQR